MIPGWLSLITGNKWLRHALIAAGAVALAGAYSAWLIHVGVQKERTRQLAEQLEARISVIVKNRDVERQAGQASDESQLEFVQIQATQRILTQTRIVEVIRYVESPDRAECVHDPEWVRINDAAAANRLPGAGANAADTDSPATAAGTDGA
ncbi:MAG: hypothetical protein AAGI11_15245 [Pseudomonadota bacterium]